MKPNVITSCQSKRKYDSKNEADLTVEYLWKEKDISVESYKCQICLGWHLTSTK